MFQIWSLFLDDHFDIFSDYKLTDSIFISTKWIKYSTCSKRFSRFTQENMGTARDFILILFLVQQFVATEPTGCRKNLTFMLALNSRLSCIWPRTGYHCLSMRYTLGCWGVCTANMSFFTRIGICTLCTSYTWQAHDTHCLNSNKQTYRGLFNSALNIHQKDSSSEKNPVLSKAKQCYVMWNNSHLQNAQLSSVGVLGIETIPMSSNLWNVYFRTLVFMSTWLLLSTECDIPHSNPYTDFTPQIVAATKLAPIVRTRLYST